MDFANALLSETVSSGNATHVRSLLAAGADPNQTSQGGQTPLILAIVSGNLHLVQMLLEAGADPSQRDQTGLSAIEWADRKGFPDVARALQNPKQARANSSAQATATRSNSDSLRNPALAADEKSRRWIAGLKQRLDEKADRQKLETSESKAAVASSGDLAPSEIAPAHEETPQTVAPETQPPMPDLSQSAVESKALATDSSPNGTSSTGSARKRCPQCNTEYNSPLVAYCAYHVVPLIDIDAPVIAPPAPRGMTPLLWALVLVTFAAAGVAAYIGIAPLYKKQASSVAVQPTPVPTTPGKGIPIVSGDLSGKALVIPDVFAPTKLTEPVTVTVRIKVDKKGQVYSAQAVGGDEQLQSAVLQSARKAEFSTADLGPRGSQATITYMFKP